MLGADGDVVMSGLQPEIKLKKLKTSGSEKLHAERSKLAAETLTSSNVSVSQVSGTMSTMFRT